MSNAKISRRKFSVAMAGGAAAVASPLFAQPAWPNKPIRIIVPYTPGGFTDQMARIVQIGLQNRLQQTITIDNKPGANSIIGVDALAKAPADRFQTTAQFAAARWAEPLKVDLSKFPLVAAFQKRVAERPAVKAALEAEGLLKAA